MQHSIVIAGVDEAGRGSLVGPVIAAAVILQTPIMNIELKDSKLLTQKQREECFSIIKKISVAIGIGRAEAAEIDELNIYQATLLAMKRSVEELCITPELVLIDGRATPKLAYQTKAIIHGDRLEPIISAASIIAKVVRDKEMLILHERYPIYNFAKNKGYFTKEHRKLLDKYGPCPLHRKSFIPIAKLLNH